MFSVLALAALGTSLQSLPPRLERCEPHTVSVDSMLTLEGRTLRSPTGRDHIRVYFRRDGVSIQAHETSGYFSPNTPDALHFVVPEGVTPGQWQVVGELDGTSSEPCVVEVTDWTPPSLESTSLAVVYPGERIEFAGMNFHRSDVVEIEDSTGAVRTVKADCCSVGHGPTVAVEAAAGRTLLRIGSEIDGVKRFSNPLEITVTDGPIPFELWQGEAEPVAAGQWTYLSATMETERRPERAERIDVEFAQRDRVVMVGTNGPHSLRVQVPETLAAGHATIRARLWRDGRASSWSEAVEYDILPRPTASVVRAVGVDGDGSRGYRPARPGDELLAHPGEALFLHGDFPVGSCDELNVAIESSAGQVRLSCVISNSGVRATLSPTVPPGFWRMAVTTTGGAGRGLRHDVPITIRIE